MLRNLIFAPVLLWIASVSLAAEIVGRVVSVSDGDTVTLLVDGREQHKIRLAGIDAPEKGQPYGRRSKEQLSTLVFSRTVRVEFNKRDKYGRLVGKVLTKDSDINLQMLESGMAWHYKRYELEQSVADRTAYTDAENRARSARFGLWSQDNPVAPWDYRQRVK